jgi:ribosomal protein L33
MRSTRIHSAEIKDEIYHHIGVSKTAVKHRLNPNARPPCPHCHKYHLRTVSIRQYAITKNKKSSKTEIIIGKWCQGCGYFVQTYKKPEGT